MGAATFEVDIRLDLFVLCFEAADIFSVSVFFCN
jgi:hypothetical protein